MSDLATIQAAWDQAAREDAMFNIVTDPRYANGGWNPAEFFQHGKTEIDQAMERLVSVGVSPDFYRALDFGCGIGRLAQSLALYAAHVDGVDVSEEMIAQADALNSNHRVHYHHNPTSNLELFTDSSFDLVYSMIVLQHMPQDLQQGYVREFFRVLKPGGIAMFEMPDGPDEGHPGWWLSMYGVPRATAEKWIAAAGGVLVDVEDLGQHAQWRCFRYTAVRP